MRLQCTVAGVLLIGSSLWLQAFANPMVMSRTPEKVSKIAPKVFIVSMVSQDLCRTEHCVDRIANLFSSV